MAIKVSGVNKLYFINQMPLFSNLSASERRIVAARAYAIEYKKGEVLYRQKDPPDALYCLAAGRLGIFTTRPDGSEETLEYLYRGGYTGIISLLTGEPHSVNVRATNDSVIFKIDKEDFASLLKSVPQLAINMSQSLSRRLRRKDLHEKRVFESTIISIYSNTRKAGCTTYAINLALSLAKETSKRVVLLDISRSGEAISDILNLRPKSKAIDLRQTAFDYRRIKDTILCHTNGIDIVNISHNPEKESNITHITPLLTYLAGDYHYIIADLPSKMDQTVFKALLQSDIIHIITNPEQRMLESTRELTDRLEKSMAELAPKIKIIVNEIEEGRLNYKKEMNILKKKIYGTIPLIHPGELRSSAKSAVIVLSQPESGYARMIKRIARDIGGVLIGLALGSGAALGLIHIGVLKVLEREKIPIDIIAGSSIGALIAALWASGKNSKELEDMALKFKDKRSILRLLDPIIPTSSLIRGRNIIKVLHKFLGRKTFQNVTLPLKIVAANIDKREVVVLDEGRLRDAVLASIAIPGVFKPVRRGRRILVDGGILEPVPIGTLARMGTKKIIAVNPLPSPEDIASRLERIEKHLKEEMARPFAESPINYIRCRIFRLLEKIFVPNIFDIMVKTILGMEYEIAEASCQQADIVIHPRMTTASWYEFFNAEEIIRVGEKEAERLLPEIKNLVRE